MRYSAFVPRLKTEFKNQYSIYNFFKLAAATLLAIIVDKSILVQNTLIDSLWLEKNIF